MDKALIGAIIILSNQKNPLRGTFCSSSGESAPGEQKKCSWSTPACSRSKSAPRPKTFFFVLCRHLLCARTLSASPPSLSPVPFPSPFYLHSSPMAPSDTGPSCPCRGNSSRTSPRCGRQSRMQRGDSPLHLHIPGCTACCSWQAPAWTGRRQRWACPQNIGPTRWHDRASRRSGPPQSRGRGGEYAPS